MRQRKDYPRLFYSCEGSSRRRAQPGDPGCTPSTHTDLARRAFGMKEMEFLGSWVSKFTVATLLALSLHAGI